MSLTINTITGYIPFRDNLAPMKVTDNPSCPKCGANTDSNIHFFDCIYYRKIRKITLNIDPKLQNDQNDHHYLADNIKMSGRFDTN